MHPAYVCDRTEAKEVAGPLQQEETQGQEVCKVAICEIKVVNRFRALEQIGLEARGSL